MLTSLGDHSAVCLQVVEVERPPAPPQPPPRVVRVMEMDHCRYKDFRKSQHVRDIRNYDEEPVYRGGHAYAREIRETEEDPVYRGGHSVLVWTFHWGLLLQLFSDA